MKRRTVFAVALAVVDALYALMAVWWWALTGMSQDVGLATGVTIALGAIAVVALMLP